MALRVIDTGTIWKGERVRGRIYTSEIENKLSDKHLRERGFERVNVIERVEAEPLPPPVVNAKTETI